jgi:hypothetical protein
LISRECGASWQSEKEGARRRVSQSVFVSGLGEYTDVWTDYFSTYGDTPVEILPVQTRLHFFEKLENLTPFSHSRRALFTNPLSLSSTSFASYIVHRFHCCCWYCSDLVSESFIPTLSNKQESKKKQDREMCNKQSPRTAMQVKY